MAVLSRMSDEHVLVIELVPGVKVHAPDEFCNSITIPDTAADPTCSNANGADVPMPTLPVGVVPEEARPVPKITLPILRKLEVLFAGVSTPAFVPIKILFDPVISVVLATLKPSTVLLEPLTPEPVLKPKKVSLLPF